MKKLPKIYQNEFNKKISNNKKTCYIKNEEQALVEPMTEIKIKKIIDEVFSGLGYSYNIPLTITTKTKEYQTSLIAKTKNRVVTLDNDIIPLSEIISIKKN